MDFYNSGLSSRKIVDKTGISNTQVRRILKKEGVVFRSLKTPDEVESKIIELYVSGISSEKIAKDLDMDGSTVCRIIKRNKEFYSSEETQAYHNRTFEQFVSEWWVPTVNNVYNSLKNDSLFIVNMDNKMFEKMYKPIVH